MKFVACACVVALTLGGCGGEETSRDGDPKCEQWTQRDVTADEVVNGCSIENNGTFTQAGTAVHECDDGRTLYWNDAGWGYVGEPMTPHEANAEQVAPLSERNACPA